MVYNIGDVLMCKEKVNAQCLNLSNHYFEIKEGDLYKVTEKDDFSDKTHCYWYELTSLDDENIVLTAWNDEGHMIIDDKFERIRQGVS